MTWICETCGVETADLPAPPEACEICEDERQWVPEDGQHWTTLEALAAAGTRIAVTEVEPDLWGLRAEPSVGIGQQTMVVRVPEGVLLFDCVGYVDDDTVERVRSLGPTLGVCRPRPAFFRISAIDTSILGPFAAASSSCSRFPSRRSLSWRINSLMYSLGVPQSPEETWPST